MATELGIDLDELRRIRLPAAIEVAEDHEVF